MTELDTIEDDFTFDMLKDLPVLNAIMNESWRKDPPAPQAWRMAKRDLDYNGYRIPAGCRVAYNVLLAANDESVYRKGRDEFKFERFLPQDHPLADPTWYAAVNPNDGRGVYPIFGGTYGVGRSFFFSS